MNKLTVIILILSCFVGLSCDRVDPQDEVEYVEIKLQLKGVDITAFPMTRASSDDLYGVEIMQGEEIYATWLTDDITSSTIRLLRGKTYSVYVCYVPDGKNILYSSGNTYGSPFFHLGPLKTPELGHGIYYGGQYDMNYAGFGTAQKKEKSSYYIQANAWNEVDVYYGLKQVVAESNAEISVDLYRQMFGLEITATNFSKGELYVYSGMAGNSYGEAKGYDAYIYKMTPSSPNLDLVLEMSYMPWCAWGIGATTEDEVKNWESPENWEGAYDEQLRIAYATPDGDILELVSQKIHAHRMTKYTATIDVESLVQEYYGTLAANVKESDWTTQELVIQ